MNESKQKTQRQIQKEQTRERLIEAAIAEYARRGITAATTADIAAAAGVSHGTVFAHFGTQEVLLDTVIEVFGLRISRRLHELAASSTGLRDVLSSHLQGLAEYEQFYTRLVTEGRLLPESARHTLTAIQSTISFHIGQAAADEMQAGRMGNYPVHLLFNTWVGLIHHYICNSDLFVKDGSVLERYGTELLDHYMGLVAHQEQKDRKGMIV